MHSISKRKWLGFALFSIVLCAVFPCAAQQGAQEAEAIMDEIKAVIGNTDASQTNETKWKQVLALRERLGTCKILHCRYGQG